MTAPVAAARLVALPAGYSAASAIVPAAAAAARAASTAPVPTTRNLGKIIADEVAHEEGQGAEAAGQRKDVLKALEPFVVEGAYLLPAASG